jgi:hypothetical protein
VEVRVAERRPKRTEDARRTRSRGHLGVERLGVERLGVAGRDRLSP